MQDLTTGSLTGHLLKTTSFMLVSMIFQTLYILIDLFWVGRLGTDAIAAVGLAGNISFIVIAITQVLGVGSTTLISHAAGRKDQERATFLFNQSQVLAMVVAVIFLVVAMALRHQYAAEQSATEGMRIATEQYLLWFLPAMALQFAMVAMGAALRGTGNFKPGMIVQTATVVINMATAPFLIFGWITHRPLGVAGAALATLVAVAIGALWMLTFFLQRSSFLQFRPAEWKPRFDLWASMLKVGLPAGAEFALMAVFLFIVYVISRPFGAAAQAGFGIGMRIIQAGFMPVVALGFAVAPVAGQNYGAKLADRVKATFKDAAFMSTAVMALFALLSHIAPRAMIGVFSRDPAVIDVGTEYLKIVSWNYVASGLIFVNSSMFQAMGNTIPSLITSAVRITLVAIPALWLQRYPGFQLNWVWYISVGAVLVHLALSLLLLKREFDRRLAF